MVVEGVVAFKHAIDFLQKRRIGVQARHLVLVFVSHELEEVARHRLGERGFVQRDLGRTHTLDQAAVARGIGGVLVVGQKSHTPRNHVIHTHGLVKLHGLSWCQRRLHCRPVVSTLTAPSEGRLVECHRHVVEFHGPHQGLVAQRHPTFLPGIAQDHGVDEDAVAQGLHRHAVGVKQAQTLRTNGLRNFSDALIGWVLPVGVFDKRGGGRAVGIERHMGAPGAHALQGFFARGDDRVAAQNQVG